MDRQHPSHSSFHGSLRSRDSSSTSGSDPREKIKDCLRKFIAFMFTQVGVGALVVCYSILGAVSFMHIEKDSPDRQLEDVKQWRHKCADELWNITLTYNVLNETLWVHNVDNVLMNFQKNVSNAIHNGYNGRTPDEVWSFPAALMYSLSVFTMIGYGNIVPKTTWGKLGTIAYACFGIPIYVLYFCNMGKVLAKTFKWLYITAHECSRRDDNMVEYGEFQMVRRKITVPSTACLWVITFYILTGTIMFGTWEKWNYLDSSYFCVISLCKIGFGDFVPGANITDSAGGSHLKLVINFIYVLFGMGLVAMCYNLMCEDVRVKVRELREDLKNCLDDITYKLTARLTKVSRMVALIRQVRGLEGRSNDVLFLPASKSPPHVTPPGTVVFFGGDVQDLPEAMCEVRESKSYVTWSLTATAKSLSYQFPLHHILVVRAARMETHTVTCYDNFVPSSNVGVPDHTPTHSALQHLERLLQGVTERLRTMTAEELNDITSQDIDHKNENRTSDDGEKINSGLTVPSCSAPPEQMLNKEHTWWQKSLCLDRSQLTLIGFSKGCVVLNQLVYEFHYTKTLTPGDKEALRFMEHIDSMYWLDGGHAGGKNTWLTSRSLLETLARLDINIFVHVSPYQVEDDRRPWIGREERAFVSLLTKLGAKVKRYIHPAPDSGSPTLITHFSVLANFKRLQEENCH